MHVIVWGNHKPFSENLDQMGFQFKSNPYMSPDSFRILPNVPLKNKAKTKQFLADLAGKAGFVGSPVMFRIDTEQLQSQDLPTLIENLRGH